MSNDFKIKYFSIYALVFVLSYLLFYHFLNDFMSDFTAFIRNITFSFIFSLLLLPFTIYYDFTNMVDLAWGSIFLGYFSIYLTNMNYNSFTALIDTKINSLLVIISLANITICCLFYSIRHIMIYSRAIHSPSIKNEDFRYKDLRKIKNKYIYWLVNFISYHFIPLIFVSLGFNSFFTLLDNVILLNGRVDNISQLRCFILTVASFSSYFAILLTAIADEQLFLFRVNKKLLKENNQKIECQVIKYGLWAKCRHPNYLGEILFYFAMFIQSFIFINEIALLSLIGIITIISMFNFFSIPLIEKKLLSSYGKEYEDYIKSTTRLIKII